MKRLGYGIVLLLHLTFPVLRLGELMAVPDVEPTETLPASQVRDETDEATAAAASNESIVEGRILSVGILRLSLTTLSSDPVSFNVDKNATITLNGSTARLQDLSMGDFALVKANRMGNTLIAMTIQARTPF